ncbi:hypothetical protein C8D70_1232 [Chryseobacterium sp. CBTAP 102]|nr:hypothetical protein C8D70_1232 [Chryseobacterium sp. CBTAP 102]
MSGKNMQKVFRFIKTTELDSINEIFSNNPDVIDIKEVCKNFSKFQTLAWIEFILNLEEKDAQFLFKYINTQ